MIVKMDTDFVSEKMEELCSAILNQDAYIELRSKIEKFTENEEAVKQYEEFADMQRSLQEKEQREGLSPSEIAAYEQIELELYDNPVIREFLNAQREFSDVHSIINQYFTKTIELNRLPSRKEIKKGGCGCGGACGNH
ncbi:YlbF family regulator [Lederbergia graminis]|uniref:YlbF family regulator n=1 Tax=Lederbergia graminis TaxID=735518 RepID=A0ABW0LKG6_9BACI